MSGFFVAGTDTGVGKTRVTCALLAAFRASGVTAGGMKPVAAGWIGPERGDLSEDVAKIAAVTGQNPHDRELCPYSLRDAISPHISARNAGVSIQIATIRSSFDELRRVYPLIIVEGAGGWLTPIDNECTMADVAAALGLPVILVVGLRLGCLNHAALTARAIAADGLPLAGWIGNQIDPEFRELDANIERLTHCLGSPPLAVLPFGGDDASVVAALESRADRVSAALVTG